MFQQLSHGSTTLTMTDLRAKVAYIDFMGSPEAVDGTKSVPKYDLGTRKK